MFAGSILAFSTSELANQRYLLILEALAVIVSGKTLEGLNFPSSGTWLLPKNFLTMWN